VGLFSYYVYRSNNSKCIRILGEYSNTSKSLLKLEKRRDDTRVV